MVKRVKGKTKPRSGFFGPKRQKKKSRRHTKTFRPRLASKGGPFEPLAFNFCGENCDILLFEAQLLNLSKLFVTCVITWSISGPGPEMIDSFRKVQKKCNCSGRRLVLRLWFWLLGTVLADTEVMSQNVADMRYVFPRLMTFKQQRLTSP